MADTTSQLDADLKSVMTGVKCAYPNCSFLSSTMTGVKLHTTAVHDDQPPHGLSCAIRKKVDEEGEIHLEEVTVEEDSDGEDIVAISANLESDESSAGMTQKPSPNLSPEESKPEAESSKIASSALPSSSPNASGVAPANAPPATSLVMCHSSRMSSTASTASSGSTLGSSSPDTSSQTMHLSRSQTPPLSQSSSLASITSFSSTFSADAQAVSATLIPGSVSDEEKMEKILELASQVQSTCRICFHRREVGGSRHWTFRCGSGICSGSAYKTFKSHIPFPSPTPVCFFCFAPFGPLFHYPPALANKASPKDCIFADALKELTYVIYEDQETRQAVFNRLGCAVPSTVTAYKVYISKRNAGGPMGLYEVLNAYIDTRREI